MRGFDSQVSHTEAFANSNPGSRLCSVRWRHAVCCQKKGTQSVKIKQYFARSLWGMSSDLHTDLVHCLSGQCAPLIFHQGFSFTKKRNEKLKHLDKTFVKTESELNYVWRWIQTKLNTLIFSFLLCMVKLQYLLYYPIVYWSGMNHTSVIYPVGYCIMHKPWDYIINTYTKCCICKAYNQTLREMSFHFYVSMFSLLFFCCWGFRGWGWMIWP